MDIYFTLFTPISNGNIKYGLLQDKVPGWLGLEMDFLIVVKWPKKVPDLPPGTFSWNSPKFYLLFLDTVYP